MSWQRRTWLCVLVVGCGWSSGAFGAAPKSVTPLELGAPAPDFALPGVDGQTYRLADFASAKVLVVLFTCNHCPTAQAYDDRIVQLHADFKGRGVALVAISPNDPLAVRLDELGYTDLSDSLEEMKVRAKDRAFAFPYPQVRVGGIAMPGVSAVRAPAASCVSPR